MENSSDSNQPDFWTVRYAAGKTPWDFGGVPAGLKSFLARSSAPGRVLIPGCGSGYELQAFHDAGYDVIGIDFSPAAVDHAKSILGDLGEHRGRLCFSRQGRLFAPTPGRGGRAAQSPPEHHHPANWRFKLPEGDPAKGRAVFVKYECYSCHKVRGEDFPEGRKRLS